MAKETTAPRAMTDLQQKNLEKYALQNRTPEERSRIAKMGVEARQRKKDEKMQLQKCMRELLNLEVNNPKSKEVLRKFGFKDDELNNKTLLMVALFQKGVQGDVSAIKETVNMMEKLDMFDDTGKMQQNVIINLVPVGEQYTPNAEDEQEIWDVENNTDWMDKDDNDEWDADAEDDDWGEEVYDGQDVLNRLICVKTKQVNKVVSFKYKVA